VAWKEVVGFLIWLPFRHCPGGNVKGYYKVRSGSLFPDYCLKAGLPEYGERMLPKEFALLGCYAA
jgi:hypothetical protein